jgi:hypothetical protein
MLTLSKHISSDYFVEITDLGGMTRKCEKCSYPFAHTETQKYWKQDSVTELLSYGVSVSDH